MDTKMEHKGTVTLETARLILRRFTPDDAGAMYRNWATDPEVTKYLTWPVHQNLAVSEKIAQEWSESYVKPDYYQWAIVPKSVGEPIGSIAVVAKNDDIDMVHIGYCIGQKWWHCGYTSEALIELVRFFFEEVGANRIESRHDPRNPNSGRVMMKADLKYEHTSRQSDRNNQGICDASHYAILAEDYFSNSSKQSRETESNIATIRLLTELMFQNLRIAMDTSNWNADICGAPAWRYIYHTIHSAHKWFINPSKRFEDPEPPFHTPGLDWPDTPSDKLLTSETLYDYYEQVRKKVLDYIGGIDDIHLSERPAGCDNTRLCLIMEQFRHIYAHIGILNGVTIAHTGKYPRVVNLEYWRSGNLPDGLYDDDVRVY